MARCGSEKGDKGLRTCGAQVDNDTEQFWRSGKVAGGRDREADCDSRIFASIGGLVRCPLIFVFANPTQFLGLP